MKLFSSHCCGELSESAWFTLKMGEGGMIHKSLLKSKVNTVLLLQMNLSAEPCCPPDGLNASQITPTLNFKSKTLPERVFAIVLIGVSEAFRNSLLAG